MASQQAGSEENHENKLHSLELGKLQSTIKQKYLIMKYCSVHYVEICSISNTSEREKNYRQVQEVENIFNLMLTLILNLSERLYLYIYISSIIGPRAPTQHSCYETLSSALFTDGIFWTQPGEQIAVKHRAIRLRHSRPVSWACEALSTEIR